MTRIIHDAMTGETRLDYVHDDAGPDGVAPDLLRFYMEPAVAVIAKKIERDLLALWAGFKASDTDQVDS